jgi:hypothetical protein
MPGEKLYTGKVIGSMYLNKPDVTLCSDRIIHVLSDRGRRIYHRMKENRNKENVSDL